MENRSKPASKRDGKDRSVTREPHKSTNEELQADRTPLRAHSRGRQEDEHFDKLTEPKSGYASNGMLDFAIRILDECTGSNDIEKSIEPSSFDCLTPVQRWEYNSIIHRRGDSAVPQVKTFAEFASLSDRLFPSTAHKPNKAEKPVIGPSSASHDDALAEEEMLAIAFGDMAADLDDGWSVASGSSSLSDLGTPPSMSGDSRNEGAFTNNAPQAPARKPSPIPQAAILLENVTVRLKKDVVAKKGSCECRPPLTAKRQPSADLSSTRGSKRRSTSSIPHVGGVMPIDERVSNGEIVGSNNIAGPLGSKSSSSSSV